MLQWTFFATVVATTLIGCGDDLPDRSLAADQTEAAGHPADRPICSNSLSDFCRGPCSITLTGTTGGLCAAHVGFDVYANDCGGQTVETPSRNGPVRLAAAFYYFDAAEQLIGAARHSDSLRWECVEPEFYGRKCNSAGEILPGTCP